MAILIAIPVNTPPINQRWMVPNDGRRTRNSAMVPAEIATSALIDTLITIYVMPNISDCVSTLPCMGLINCGRRER